MIKQKMRCNRVLLLLIIPDSGCDDSQFNALTSNKEVGTSSQKSSDNDAQGT